MVIKGVVVLDLHIFLYGGTQNFQSAHPILNIGPKKVYNMLHDYSRKVPFISLQTSNRSSVSLQRLYFPIFNSGMLVLASLEGVR